MSEQTSVPTRKRAQRVQLACLPCRVGKLKCNRDLPSCDQCLKRSRESSCTYTERGLRYNSAKHKAESMREKIDRLESFVNRLKTQKGDDNVLDALTEDRKPDISKTHASEVEPGSSSPSLKRGSLSLTDKLRHDYADGRTEWTGPSHWESIIEDIADVKAYFESHGSPDESESLDAMTSPSQVSQMDIPFGISQAYSREQLLSMVPPKPEADRLVAAWFNSMDPMKTVLHVNIFQDQYQDFWQTPHDYSTAWIACFFAVISLGAEINGQTRKDTLLLSQAEDYRRLASHALVLADYARVPLYVIPCTLLLIMSRIYHLHDVDGTSWLLLGVVERLSLRVGLHRDPEGVAEFAPWRRDLRRRFWLHIRILDTMIAYQFGMRSVVNLLAMDVQPPANMQDVDFSVNPPPPPRPREEYTPMLFVIEYGALSGILGDVIASSHEMMEPSRSKITSLWDKLEQWQADCPRVLRAVPFDQSLFDNAELVLHRLHLVLLCKRAVMVLHSRFINTDEHDIERQRCLDAAEESLRWQISYLEAAQPGGQLENTAVYARRHLHDFNLAATLMCSHFRHVETKGSSSERATRYNPLILQACNLWLRLGTNSAKSEQALRAIERFVRSRTPSSERETAPVAVERWTNNVTIPNQMQPPVTLTPEQHHQQMAAMSLPQPTSNLQPFGVTDSFEAVQFAGLLGAQAPLFQDLFGTPFATETVGSSPSAGVVVSEGPQLPWPPIQDRDLPMNLPFS